jgi:polysaccharide pyruvyl transferase WcaK-like protein
MRIVIHAGSYYWGNVGDVAMLQAGVERLRALWPDASIAAVTHASESLAAYCPGVEPIRFSDHAAFFGHRFFGRADRLLPRPVRDALTSVEHGWRRKWPAGLGTLIAAKRAVARKDHAAPLRYVRALQRADLVLATGGGIFTDAFTENALAVLATLEFALDRHSPTALMGQGIGPVSNATLKRRMAEILPRVNLIAVRERLESVRLLHALGVAPERIIVTGDDAVEMANRCAPPAVGTAIGVNVRMAGYSGINAQALRVIREVLQRAAARLEARLEPVPIAQHPDAHDGVAIHELLAGYGNAGAVATDVRTPADIITTISRCRVVLTGSYHAAVFALAQGIPAVAMAASPYYVNKFGGLADLFPGGCEVVRLNDPESAAVLESAIGSAWASAPRIKDVLLDAACHQIELGRAAYAQLRSIAA